MDERTIPEPMPLDRVASLFDAVRAEVSKVIVGQEGLIEGVLVGLFAEGNILLEGRPGLGKTLLVNVLAQSVSCHFRRIQFTPDLMPSDLTGHSVYDMKEQEFHFKPGPVFTSTSARTRSGCASAYDSENRPPIESPPTIAGSSPLVTL